MKKEEKMHSFREKKRPLLLLKEVRAVFFWCGFSLIYLICGGNSFKLGSDHQYLCLSEFENGHHPYQTGSVRAIT